MSPNLTASSNQSREVRSWLLGRSLCVFLALGSIASTAAAAQMPTSEPGNNPRLLAQFTGAIVRPALKQGSRGSEVIELQAALKLLGFYADSVDGIFSQSTAKAVSQFQEAAGIAPDGIVGQDTWNRLFPATDQAIENPIANTPTTGDDSEIDPQVPPTNFPVLRRRMRGPAVRDLQERLRAKGFLRASADGVFGSETQAAVKAAQRRYQLPADGIVGRATWEALLR
ncbi:peptidoglycan-binding protein [Microcoleus sp. LEGE 07076]|uniref:peptidoglycan-binding domain-containing protein n=1 Tax=Microcoleus sp. LEGE 07076 TaxID=915322 RepID=UPI0018806062|nr:peptidoglycan-binding protein [Microcoleus sp. LEGE 07076]MBE9185093.1 peptidoglycan-binding protein [Microcoleus sp. LEGE 07076]